MGGSRYISALAPSGRCAARTRSDAMPLHWSQHIRRLTTRWSRRPGPAHAGRRVPARRVYAGATRRGSAPTLGRSNLMSHFLLFWAAMPAVVLSLWLLRIAEAPRSVQAAQVVVAAVAVAIHFMTMRLRPLKSLIDSQWLALPIAASLFIPLIAGPSGSPARWLVLGSARLYIAPVVLPVALFLLAASHRTPAIYVVSVTAAAMALVLQPDAPQLTAFALALCVLLATEDLPLPLRLGLFIILLSGVVATWRTPTFLSPVRYVEGVFTIAAEASPLALVAAMISAALPVASLAWIARVMRSRGVFAVAVYFGALFSLAPLQITPVPLLGFGSGPILGYFLVAGIITRNRGDETA